MKNNIRIEDALKILELPTTLFLSIIHAGSPQKAKDELENFRTIIRKQRKILAKKYHPDVYDGDDTRIKQINNIIDFLETLKIVVQQRPVQVYNSVFTGYYNDSTTTSSYSDIFRTHTYYTNTFY